MRVGFLRPGLVITAGYNGYGGSYTTAVGHAAAEMAMTNVVPDWLRRRFFRLGGCLRMSRCFLLNVRVSGETLRRFVADSEYLSKTLRSAYSSTAEACR